MTNNVQKALDYQAKLEDQINPGKWEYVDGDIQERVHDYAVVTLAENLRARNGVYIAHLRNQAALARAVIEAWSTLQEVGGAFPSVIGEYDKTFDAMVAAVAAWADHVLGDSNE